MTQRVVVDASAGVEIAAETPTGNAMLKLVPGGARLYVPEHFYEVSPAWTIRAPSSLRSNPRAADAGDEGDGENTRSFVTDQRRPPST